MLESPAEIVPLRARRQIRGKSVAQEANLTVPVEREGEAVLSKGAPEGAGSPVALVTEMVAARVVEKVGGEIEKLKRARVAVERGGKGRVGPQVAGDLSGLGQGVSHALFPERGGPVAERECAKAVPPPEDAVSIGRAESGLPRRARKTQLAPEHQPQCRALPERQSEVARKGSVVKKAVRVLVVGADPGPVERVVESARLTCQAAPSPPGGILAALGAQRKLRPP